ncbi:hypothetical protein SKAU_G00074130 [Synaphobranchus kaupii]|uniref:Cadherin domain-containing protein n=1 Tax=Synaphobranchus kaupii TaxID=118154 RepID=A0A9Q1JBK8_SYNKA|nr:hypothetical protein SKAU_G00074130 [Synaphobranchus kaupii]
MARGFFFFSSLFCVVLSGSAGSCVRHSSQAEIPPLTGARNDASKGFIVQTDLMGSSALIQDRNKREMKADEINSLGASELKVLRRTKRRWSPLPFNIRENDPPPFPKEVDIIGSDSSANHSVYYKISGPGVTEPPIGLFSVDPDTGMLKVNRAVNREDYHQFIFIAKVYDRITGLETDLPLPITVNVYDVNDNPPVFPSSLLSVFTVVEHSSAGTEIGKLSAIDTDEKGTIHTKIRFTLLNGTELFEIHPKTGVISTRTNTLDREVQDKHFLSIKLQDMDGAPNGLSSIGTVTILLSDINDNPPTFREIKHTATVKENEADILVLRIPVDDKDLEKSPNWNAVYVIKKGNEKGNFRIETDPVTNEGLIYVIKPLDYEAGANVRLEVTAKNEDELVGTRASWASIPVDLTVIDEDEGPEFSAPVLKLLVKENVANGTVIGTYTALDPETKSSEGIKYYKVSDVASWINVDENTGDLTTMATLDRESPFVINNLYNITVKAVDASSKSAIGTVLILIEDVNDHVPIFPAKDMILCENDNTGSVLLVAEDKDDPPYSGPFSFELAEGHDGKWKLKDATETSVKLEPAQDLPTGMYSVPLLVEDLQSHGKVQTVSVRICKCHEGECPAQESSISLGVWAILAMLLALALLLLLCICCTFACTTQGEKIYIDDVSTGMLLKSNTEALGEEVNSGLVIIPSSAVDGSVKMRHMDRLASSSTLGKQNHMFQESMQQSVYQTAARDITMAETQNMYSSGQYGAGHRASGHFGSGHFDSGHFASGHRGSGHRGSGQYDGTLRSMHTEGTFYKYGEFSSLDTWRTNDLYLTKKLMFFETEEDGRYADDLLQEYDYEGVGSPAGSVGCCSDQEDQEDLEFLDTLGPKFKTLGDICTQN